MLCSEGTTPSNPLSTDRARTHRKPLARNFSFVFSYKKTKKINFFLFLDQGIITRIRHAFIARRSIPRTSILIFFNFLLSFVFSCSSLITQRHANGSTRVAFSRQEIKYHPNIRIAKVPTRSEGERDVQGILVGRDASTGAAKGQEEAPKSPSLWLTVAAAACGPLFSLGQFKIRKKTWEAFHRQGPPRAEEILIYGLS